MLFFTRIFIIILITQSDLSWIGQLFGRLHPLVVHFPLALLFIAAFLEILSLRNYDSKWRSAIGIMLPIGCISAIVSTGFGYLLKVYDQFEGSSVDLHQNLGILTSILSIACLWQYVRVINQKNRARILAFRGLLFSTAIVLTLTGHYGAMLTHGKDYLTEVFPANQMSKSQPFSDFDLSVFQIDSGDISEQLKLELLTEVRTVFAHSCYRCHSSDKIKGDLRLDDREFVFAGGEGGSIITPGDPENSGLVRRVSLPAHHDDVMPSKGELLSEEEISLISLWIEHDAYWPENADDLKIFRNAPLAPRYPEWPSDTAKFDNKIDVWVDQYFTANNIEWPDKIDDISYLRKIYLAITGFLPSKDEMTAFIQDKKQDKKKVWPRHLVSNNEECALHWLSFWNGILRIDYTGTGYITGGRLSITDWLYESLLENKPYRQMVKELLNPNASSKGFIAGSQWRGVVNESQRTEMQAAQNVAQVVMGLNLKCASCHDSFTSDWKLEDAYAFANIFSETTLEISRCDEPTGRMAPTRLLWDDLGQLDPASSLDYRLEEVSEKLTSEKNGRMYRTIVNRIWAQLMGRGIIEPLDEMDELPWSQDLLDWLAVNFVGNGFDLKELIFTIVTSDAYQLQSVSAESELALLDENYIFQGPVLRKLSAEQFADIVSMTFNPVFSEEETRFSPPRQKMNSIVRAVQVANNDFLKALGRPDREVVTTSRNDQPNLLQALELTNGNRLSEALKKGAEFWREKSENTDELVTNTFELLLGRIPLPHEKNIVKESLGNNPEIGEIQDFFWAMILHPEFQFIN